MEKVKTFYSSGEMARMNGINKRTLHYYNDIGLFTPDKIGANGFHYYSCLQSAKLEMILMLRKIGMPIEDIKKYLTGPNLDSFEKILSDNKQLIEKSIRELEEAKNFLERKERQIDMIKSFSIGKIEQIELPRRKLLYSDAITGAYDDDDFLIAAEFSQRLKRIFGVYDNFGSRISTESINNGDFDSYTSFFAYADSSGEFDGIMEKGKYLRTYSLGQWHKLKDVYENILDYADKNNLVLVGDSYEEGLNEMLIENIDQYITMITIRYEERQ